MNDPLERWSSDIKPEGAVVPMPNWGIALARGITMHCRSLRQSICLRRVYRRSEALPVLRRSARTRAS
jgi:hypothetical protein